MCPHSIGPRAQTPYKTKTVNTSAPGRKAAKAAKARTGKETGGKERAEDERVEAAEAAKAKEMAQGAPGVVILTTGALTAINLRNTRPTWTQIARSADCQPLCRGRGGLTR